MGWTVRRVCTRCNKLFTAPDKSMRKLCGACIRVSDVTAVTGLRPTKRDTYLLRTYNLSEAEYIHMSKMQGGVCAICHKPPKRGTRLHVDHDHTALTVRGLLCTGCNTRLGWLEAHYAAIQIYLGKRPR